MMTISKKFISRGWFWKARTIKEVVGKSSVTKAKMTQVATRCEAERGLPRIVVLIESGFSFTAI